MECIFLSLECTTSKLANLELEIHYVKKIKLMCPKSRSWLATKRIQYCDIGANILIKIGEHQATWKPSLFSFSGASNPAFFRTSSLVAIHFAIRPPRWPAMVSSLISFSSFKLCSSDLTATSTLSRSHVCNMGLRWTECMWLPVRVSTCSNHELVTI